MTSLQANCMEAKTYAYMIKDKMEDNDQEALGSAFDLFTELTPNDPDAGPDLTNATLDTPPECVKQYHRWKKSVSDSLNQDSAGLPIEEFTSMVEAMEKAGSRGLIDQADAHDQGAPKHTLTILGEKVGLLGQPGDWTTSFGVQELNFKRKFEELTGPWKDVRPPKVEKKKTSGLDHQAVWNLFHDHCRETLREASLGLAASCTDKTTEDSCRTTANCEWIKEWQGQATMDP